MTAPLSSPEPTAAHPSVDELADLAEGLVESAADAAALRRHLDGCAECRGTAEAFGEVRALLGAVEPPDLPADVAARLDAALAAAVAERDAVAQGTAGHDAAERRAAGAADVTDGPAAAPQTAWKAVVGPRAGAAPAVPSRPVPDPSSAPPAAPGRPPGRPSGPSAATGPGRARPRRRRLGLLLGAAAVLIGAGLGGSLLLSMPGRTASDTAAVSAGAPAAGTVPSPAASARPAQSPKAEQTGGGTVYRDDRLADQVRHLLAGTGPTTDGPVKPGSSPAVTGGAPPADAQPGIAGGQSSTACPAPADAPLLAGDRGSYAGAPAELLVYAVPGRSDRVDVYLRSPDCGPVLVHLTVETR
ncbi:zf-HC2 domain-containing protein [Kitasatospora hibisci]|uniref:zf-HC2 domain-containing protein n=1 Tax=Kitasatospora hibisci TaxID=3369522 RepID=UPI0037546741